MQSILLQNIMQNVPFFYTKNIFFPPKILQILIDSVLFVGMKWINCYQQGDFASGFDSQRFRKRFAKTLTGYWSKVTLAFSIYFYLAFARGKNKPKMPHLFA